MADISLKAFYCNIKKEDTKMNNKKIRKQVEEVIYKAGLEHIQQNYHPVYSSMENKQPDNMKEKSILDCKCEEATRNEFETKKYQLYETGCQQRRMEKYKKELEKVRKSRKKVVEEQQNLKYLVKNLQSQLKEVEKKCKQLEKEQQKNYQELKVCIKEKNRKQGRKIKSIKNILRYITYMGGLPFYGESLKEIEKFYKDRSRYIKKNRKPIEVDCKEF